MSKRETERDSSAFGARKDDCLPHGAALVVHVLSYY